MNKEEVDDYLEGVLYLLIVSCLFVLSLAVGQSTMLEIVSSSYPEKGGG